MSRTNLGLLAAAAVCFSCCLCGILFPSRSVVGESSDRMASSNNLKQIALAFGNYYEARGRLPPAVVSDKGGKPLYSWRVLLLPYLEAKGLYEEFRLGEPWDSPHNRALLPKMPLTYCRPRRGGEVVTHYQVLVGPGTAFERDGLTWQDFPDGLHRTFLVVEVTEPVSWTKPADLAYDPGKPLPPLGGLVRNVDPVFGFWKQTGFTAAFADGSVRFISGTTNELSHPHDPSSASLYPGRRAA